jgi:hypothetical protein
MSMIPKCVVCDSPVANRYAPDTHCERCKRPCQMCGGMVQNCRHPLPECADLEPKELPNGRFQVAA